jgi:hypothetical protein
MKPAQMDTEMLGGLPNTSVIEIIPNMLSVTPCMPCSFGLLSTPGQGRARSPGVSSK